jgi:toxin HigB-1
MIATFRNRDTELLFNGRPARRLPADIHRRARRALEYLDAAKRPEDAVPTPGGRLEQLTGDRAGQWSVRINDQWRLCFEWRDGNAYNVELVDYHR